MAGTPTLDQLVTAYHRKSMGRKPNPDHTDFAGAFAADPTLLAQAQGEAQALNNLNAAFKGKLAQRDYNQHIRMVALNGMLSKAEEVPPT